MNIQRSARWTDEKMEQEIAPFLSGIVKKLSEGATLGGEPAGAYDLSNALTEITMSSFTETDKAHMIFTLGTNAGINLNATRIIAMMEKPSTLDSISILADLDVRLRQAFEKWKKEEETKKKPRRKSNGKN